MGCILLAWRHVFWLVCLFVWHHMALLSLTGTTEEHIRGCLAQETTWTIILYSQHSNVLRCSDDRMTEKYQGYISFAQHFPFMIVQRCLRLGSHCGLKLDFGPDWIISGENLVLCSVNSTNSIFPRRNQTTPGGGFKSDSNPIQHM